MPLTDKITIILMIAISFWFLCGIIYIMGYFTITEDRQKMLDLIDERAGKLKN